MRGGAARFHLGGDTSMLLISVSLVVRQLNDSTTRRVGRTWHFDSSSHPITPGWSAKLSSDTRINPRNWDTRHVPIARREYLNSVPYLRAISLICSRVSCFGGTPGGLQVSRKKPSRPGGDMIQSRSSSRSGFANPCQEFLGMNIVPSFSNGDAHRSV